MTLVNSQPSPEQAAARQRNWDLRCLRGLYYNLAKLSPARQEAVRHIIDEEIIELGGESEAVRAAARREELNRLFGESE